MKEVFVVFIATTIAFTAAQAGKGGHATPSSNAHSSSSTSANANVARGAYGYRGAMRGMYSASHYGGLSSLQQQSLAHHFSASTTTHHRHGNTGLTNHVANTGNGGVHATSSGGHSGNQHRISYAEALHRHHREWHNCGWWRSHYHVVYIDFGWYFWDAGWWYPAWGYDPYYYYGNDAPLYSDYNNAPDNGYENSEPISEDFSRANFGNHDVVARVQEELKHSGYYYGAIDGDLGPVTRAAIANYQRDHGLAVNATIDSPTLRQLGGARVASSWAD